MTDQQETKTPEAPASPALAGQLRFGLTYVLGLASIALILGHWQAALGAWLVCLPLAMIAEIIESRHLGLSVWCGIVVAPVCPFSVLILWRWAGRQPQQIGTPSLP